MKTPIFIVICIVFISNQLYSQKVDTSEAQQFEQKAENLFENFKYDSAANNYFHAARIYEKHENWLNASKNYRFVASSFIASAKTDTAMYFILKSLDIANTKFSDTARNERFEKVEILITLGNVYYRIVNYQQTLFNYEKALHLIIDTDSTAKLEIAELYYRIGRTYLDLRHHKDAIEYCKKSLEIREKLLGKDHVDVAQTMRFLGQIYMVQGKNDKALEQTKRALQIYVKAIGEINIDVSDCYFDMGQMFEAEADFEQALEYYQKALQINLNLHKIHPKTARTYRYIGWSFHKQGDFDKALEYYNMTLHIFLQLYGEQNLSVAASFNDIASVYVKKRDFDKVLEYYQKELQIKIHLLGEQHFYVAVCYSNFGSIYIEKGNYNKALEYFHKGIQIAIQNYGEDSPNAAMFYRSIGRLYYEKKDYNRALEYFNKATQSFVQQMGEHHYLTALYYNYIGQTFNKIGDNTGDTIHGIKKSRYIDALNYYQKALMSNLIDFNDSIIYHNPEKLDPLNIPRLFISLSNKAKVLYLLSRTEKSTNDLKHSLSTFDLLFKLIYKMRNDYSHESTQLLLSEDTRNSFGDAIMAAIESEKMIYGNENIGRTFEYMEKSKGATLSAFLNDSKIKRSLNIEDSLLKKERDIASNQRNYNIKIQKDKSSREGYDTIQMQEYEDKLFYYSRQYDSLMNTLKNSYPDYYKLKYEQKVACIKDIQQQLDNNTALINYFVGDTTLFISVVTNNEFGYKIVKIDSSFNEKIVDYSIDIKSGFTENEFKSSGSLYHYLIEPVEEYIRDKNSLIIIPDGYLYYVPFETLCKNANYFADLSKIDYLVKNYSVSYHYSATLWLNSVKKSKKQYRSDYSFIGFAPVFDSKTSNGYIMSREWIGDTTTNEIITRSVSIDFKQFNALPYSEEEIKTIVRLFRKKGGNAKGYFQREASEENFNKNVQNYNFVHIASHSFANDYYPSLSGIAFSQPDTSQVNKENSEDGILYAGETYNLNLSKAELIVLSSCKSGLGKLIQGEGFLSLSRGFLYSGAPNIVFSLWNVKDEQTKDVMVQFYKQILKRKSYAKSLRGAKLKLINNPKTSEPKYWAAWILVGE